MKNELTDFGKTFSKGADFTIEEMEAISEGTQELKSQDCKYIKIYVFKEWNTPNWAKYIMYNAKNPKNFFPYRSIEKDRIIVLVGFKSLKKAPFVIQQLEDQREK